MTAVQETSRAALVSVLGSLPERRAEVLRTLARIEPACSLDLSDESGIPPNVITPRVLELRKAGLVTESHRAKSRTGRTSIFWKVARD